MPPALLDAALAPHQWGVVARVALGMALGGVVGIERQIASKPAGLRTHMLVAGAAALLVSLGETVVEGFPRDLPAGAVRTDPLRIIEAVVAGVSFLGAGTILRRSNREGVEGLTTAASLLLAAGIGVSVGLMQLVVAVGTALLALLVLHVLGRLESGHDAHPLC